MQTMKVIITEERVEGAHFHNILCHLSSLENETYYKFIPPHSVFYINHALIKCTDDEIHIC